MQGKSFSDYEPLGAHLAEETWNDTVLQWHLPSLRMGVVRLPPRKKHTFVRCSSLCCHQTLKQSFRSAKGTRIKSQEPRSTVRGAFLDSVILPDCRVYFFTTLESLKGLRVGEDETTWMCSTARVKLQVPGLGAHRASV